MAGKKGNAVVKEAKQKGNQEAGKEVLKSDENRHCSLLEFEEGTIVLEELQKRILVVIQLKDIMSVSVMGNYCSLHLGLVEKAVEFKITLTKLKSMLPGNYFWKVHHSNIVGRKHIFKFIPNADGGAVLLLHDGTVIDVSPTYMERVKHAVMEKAHFLPVEEVKMVLREKKR